MPLPMTPPALAGAGAMDQVQMMRAAAIQRLECSEIFQKLSMFAFELKSCGRHEPYGQNMQAPDGAASRKKRSDRAPDSLP